MGRLFISVGYSHLVKQRVESGSALLGANLVAMRDLVLADVRSRGVEAIAVPDDLDEAQVTRWINGRDRVGDLALELYVNAHANPAVRGTCVYYIAHNRDRKQHADLLLAALQRRLPQLMSQGALPDTQAELGQVSFCRQLVPASLYLQIGFLTNADDLALMQNHRQAIAQGIADGLVDWSRASLEGLPAAPFGTTTGSIVPPALVATPININVNGRLYGELGIMINGNPYVSVDLAERLGMKRPLIEVERCLTHGNVVYVKAIALREADIAVEWEGTTRSLNIRTVLQISHTQHEISGRGYTTEVQLLMFLKSHNEMGLSRFPDVARLYLEEGLSEGIHHDIAFAQMCVETDFLRFGGLTKPTQNNFGGLGTVSGNPEGANFPSRRIGVRAHIQHLKAYANTEPLREEVVDPRFHWVIRGGAPTIAQLSGRWSADPHYGDRILAVLRQIYEMAGLL